MDWSSVSGIVTKLAPMIATGIGGPLAGGAVSALEGVFGLNTAGSTNDKQNALASVISGATPEQLLALKKADQDYALQMSVLGFKNVTDLQAIAMGDRDSARKREETVKDNTPKILAYGITLGFFGILLFIMLGNVPANSRDILNIMLGTLGASFSGVVGYYFGSSSSSDKKSEMLANSTPI